MTTRERIMAIRLAESIQRQSKYASSIGVKAECREENPAEQKEVIRAHRRRKVLAD